MAVIWYGAVHISESADSDQYLDSPAGLVHAESH